MDFNLVTLGYLFSAIRFHKTRTSPGLFPINAHKTAMSQALMRLEYWEMGIRISGIIAQALQLHCNGPEVQVIFYAQCEIAPLMH